MSLEQLSNDPLLWDYDLPFHRMFYPLGFPVGIKTNSEEVLAAANESWGMFHKLHPVQPLQVRIGVLPGRSLDCPPSPTCRGQRNLLTNVADGENYMAIDLRQGFAFGWLTETAVRNRAYLRYHFIEGTIWVLLEALYLTSVHAACVQLDGHGILLCGDSGAGKSSLAYACAQDGWNFLSDDSSVLLRKRGGRMVTGNPYQMRFRESATTLFPELKKQPVSQRLSGDFRIELPTLDASDLTLISECEIDYLVFLNRTEPHPEGLFEFPRHKALKWLEQVVCYGEESVRKQHRAALRHLLTASVFEMRYTRLDSALHLLRGLVQNGRRVAKDCFIAAGAPGNG